MKYYLVTKTTILGSEFETEGEAILWAKMTLAARHLYYLLNNKQITLWIVSGGLW